jgi:hypothetical protein
LLSIQARIFPVLWNLESFFFTIHKFIPTMFQELEELELIQNAELDGEAEETAENETEESAEETTEEAEEELETEEEEVSAEEAEEAADDDEAAA